MHLNQQSLYFKRGRRAWHPDTGGHAVYASGMEGLLHPVGPEEVRTYWIRRGIVVTILLVLLISLGFMMSNLGRADDNATSPETTAEPVPAAADEPVAVAKAAHQAPTDGVPADIAREEAVPVPSSAGGGGAAPAAPEPARPAAAAITEPKPEEPLPPEPANTFHLTTQSSSPRTTDSSNAR
jgi:hypothetical protein